MKISISEAGYTLWKATLFLILFSGTCMKRTKGIPADECQVTPVIHILQQPGCIPKPIASYACMGRCTSYVQVSTGLIKIKTRVRRFYCRFLGAKFGKWNGLACVVRNLAKGRLQSHFSVLKRNPGRENLER